MTTTESNRTAQKRTPQRRNPIESSNLNPKSLRKAIDAHCFECNGGEVWVNRTRYCTVFSCPLWKVRKNGKGITQDMCLEAKNCS